VAEVFRIQRDVFDLDRTPRSREIAFGVTSLLPERADQARLMTLVRGHWEIENRVHWVRDVTMGEDRSQVRTKRSPHAMASLQNLAIGALRLLGKRTSPKECAGLGEIHRGLSSCWGCSPTTFPWAALLLSPRSGRAQCASR